MTNGNILVIFRYGKSGFETTAVLQNLAKNSNVNFSACVKFHVENEWEILRMCEIDV